MKNVKKILVSMAAVLLIPVCAKAAPLENKGYDFNQPNDTNVKVASAEHKVEIKSFTGGHPYNKAEIHEKATLGETIKLTADVKGATKYSFSITPRSAFEGNTTVRYEDLDTPELEWTPKYPGIYFVNLDVKDDIGNTKNAYLYFMVNELEIKSFTGGHPYHQGEIDEKAQLGETIKLRADARGGCKYSFTISPRSAFEGNRTVEYNDLDKPELEWTPKYEGIYSVRLEVKDDIGHSKFEYLYFMITK